MGPADHHVHLGQAALCTAKARDKHDRIIVQEKLDGSCVAVAKMSGEIIALGRAGYRAVHSPYVMHHRFADWVDEERVRFEALLLEGERIVGEWLAQAHGTVYDLTGREPFAAFDLMRDDVRTPYDEFARRVAAFDFWTPHLLHVGGPLSVPDAMRLHEAEGWHWPCDQVEGVVYRVERHGAVDFLAKYVRPDKEDGKYLKGAPIWLWPQP